MKLSKRDRILLPVILIGLLILGWGLMNPPSSNAATSKLLPTDQAVSKRAVAIRTIKRLTQEQQEMEPRIAQMAYDQTPEELQPRIIRDLQEISQRADVHLREIKPIRPRPLTKATGTRVGLEVRFRAPFQPNVVRFLYFVEDPKGRMVVDKISMNSADATSKTVDVTVQIAVFTRSTAGVTGANQGDANNASNTLPNG